jgi:hypothetical protein
MSEIKTLDDKHTLLFQRVLFAQLNTPRMMPTAKPKVSAVVTFLVVGAVSLFGAGYMCQFGPCCLFPLTPSALIPAGIAGLLATVVSRVLSIDWRCTTLAFVLPMLLPTAIGALSLPDEVPRLAAAITFIVAGVIIGAVFGFPRRIVD